MEYNMGLLDRRGIEEWEKERCGEEQGRGKDKKIPCTNTCITCRWRVNEQFQA